MQRHCLGSVNRLKKMTPSLLTNDPSMEVQLMYTQNSQGSAKELAKVQPTEATSDPLMNLLAVDGGLQLMPCEYLIKGVKQKFTLRNNLTLIGLFSDFWVYLIDQKHEQPIPNTFYTNWTFHPKIFSLENSIVGEAHEQLGDRIYMDLSSSCIGYKQKKVW